MGSAARFICALASFCEAYFRGRAEAHIPLFAGRGAREPEYQRLVAVRVNVETKAFAIQEAFSRLGCFDLYCRQLAHMLAFSVMR
jgi:hypothetical protein